MFSQVTISCVQLRSQSVENYVNQENAFYAKENFHDWPRGKSSGVATLIAFPDFLPTQQKCAPTTRRRKACAGKFPTPNRRRHIKTTTDHHPAPRPRRLARASTINIRRATNLHHTIFTRRHDLVIILDARCSTQLHIAPSAHKG